MNTSLKNLGLSLFLLGLLLLRVPRAQACSCMTQTIEEAARQACAVFEGVVTSVEPVVVAGESDEWAGRERVRVVLRVVQTWTPGLAEEVTITTASNSAACGVHFEVGHGYLVLADGGVTEAPVVSLCGGTQARENADAAIATLGMGVVPVSPSQRTATSSTNMRRGGCAGCSIGSRASQSATSAMTLSIMTLALLWLRRSRRV